MTMAEKQYKNYDERFLKEDTSSSEPIEIEGYIYPTVGSSKYVLINQWPDGIPIETADDLESVLKARAIISFTEESEEFSSIVYKVIPNFMTRSTLQERALCVLPVGNSLAITTEQIFNNVINPST